MERLQKALARAGVASRRDCEELIMAGRVSINGQVVTELGVKVEPGVDVLAVDGRAVSALPARVYIMLNKPAGYVSTTADPQGRPTVLDLVAQKSDARLYPVGRLDYDSEGLLLLTNDGDLTERLTHPRYQSEKEYLVWVSGRPSAAALAALRSGVPLDGKAAPVDSVEVVSLPSSSSDTTLLRVIIHEGRKREIRRLCDALGHPVRRLQRVRMGPLLLGNLAPAASRPLTEQEIAKLKAGSPAAAPHQPHPAGEGLRPAQQKSGQQPAQGETTKTRRPHADRPQRATHDHH